MRDRPHVVSVSRNASHKFSKTIEPVIRLLPGLGVEGDAHCGASVRHRSRWKPGVFVPNLRQVHLIHAELLEELRGQGFQVGPGTMGENITTVGIDLLALPTGARLQLGEEAIVEVTGLRNPCYQLDRFQPGLMQAVLDRDHEGRLVRKAGVMATVIAGGEVLPGAGIGIDLPPAPHRPLEKV